MSDWVDPGYSSRYDFTRLNKDERKRLLEEYERCGMSLFDLTDDLQREAPPSIRRHFNDFKIMSAALGGSRELAVAEDRYQRLREAVKSVEEMNAFTRVNRIRDLVTEVSGVQKISEIQQLAWGFESIGKGMERCRIEGNKLREKARR